MPWAPELFSTPALEQVLETRREAELLAVPYFAGLMADEPDALVGSFAGEPEVHHPVFGRVKGERAFREFVAQENAWLARRNVSVDDVEHVVTEEHGFEEVVIHLDGETGRVAVPHAVVADRRPDGRLEELRIYFSHWPDMGRHLYRPPLLPRNADVDVSDVVAEYQRALAAGDVDAIVATFEPDGYAREPAGHDHSHRGHDALRGFYAQLFSNGGGIPIEHCGVIDDGRSCALEYNVVRWGRTELMPQAGVAVYVRGKSGKLAAARIYDDVDPPEPTR